MSTYSSKLFIQEFNFIHVLCRSQRTIYEHMFIATLFFLNLNYVSIRL